MPVEDSEKRSNGNIVRGDNRVCESEKGTEGCKEEGRITEGNEGGGKKVARPDARLNCSRPVISRSSSSKGQSYN